MAITIDLSGLDGKNGFRLDGEVAGDLLGVSAVQETSMEMGLMT